MAAPVRRTTKQPNPYCSFREDRGLLLALVSRDLRYVAVAALIGFSGQHIPWSALLKWLA
jgi:hypothetical protein